MTKRQADTLIALCAAVILTQIFCTFLVLRSQQRNLASAQVEQATAQIALDAPATEPAPPMPPTTSVEAAPPGQPTPAEAPEKPESESQFSVQIRTQAVDSNHQSKVSADAAPTIAR